ncbi:hypothetical protein TcasGA2_TC011409 [Tribolium castaneum]|uniref:Uncharacterized protein n=1 Tax=Tribolium castaneum TaxID=7070 RepID=D6X4H3_TRICA|nr:hypothetical protein TcasGA2_TC011409 [Tribolium castaneum]
MFSRCDTLIGFHKPCDTDLTNVSITQCCQLNSSRAHSVATSKCQKTPKVPYIALLALRWNSLKALTSLGGLLRKLVTQTLFERSRDDVSSVLSPLNLCTSLISKHSMS